LTPGKATALKKNASIVNDSVTIFEGGFEIIGSCTWSRRSFPNQAHHCPEVGR
jgi:hypothetical protein